MSKQQRTAVIVSSVLTLVVLLVYVASVGLLWWQGVFDVPETEAGTRVVAAVIALVGGLFAALLTFVGVLLKYSLDARTVDLKVDAEERLKLETFIQAVGLLSTDTGVKTIRSQHAGALFALAELKHMRFALALLGEMWPGGDVSPTSACWLIDKCLRSDDKFVQDQAALILKENANQLTTLSHCYDWPEVLIDSWPEDLSLTAREQILIALVGCIRSRPRSKWPSTCINTIVVRLSEIRNREKDAMIRNGASLLLNSLINIPNVPDPWIIAHGRQPLDVGELRSELADSLNEARSATLQHFYDLAIQIEAWGTQPSNP